MAAATARAFTSQSGAPASCGFFLVVATGARVLSIRVPEWYKPPDRPIREWPFQEPFIALIVRLGGRGSQLVVAREHGAAVVNVSLYGIVRNRLEVLRFPAPFAHRLSLFGTVGTGDTTARCRRGGPLTVIGRWPTSASGTRWGLSRTDYRLSGGRFLQAGRRTTVGSQERIAALSHEWGADVAPFTGCIVARGRRL